MQIRPTDGAQRPTPEGEFPVDARPAPSEEIKDQFTRQVRVRIFPQDPLVGPTEMIEAPAEEMGTRLESPRMRTQDRAPIAIADPEGNYDYEVGTPQFDQVNAHAVVANTLHMYDRYLGRPATWAFGGALTVNTHAGRGKTAFYRRWDGSINFFEWNSSSLGKRVTTAQAADVIAHEIGHAIWDGVRPRAGYSNEAGAFHEAFGDCSALLHALQHRSNLEKALEQNGGDLRQPSLLSRMAEEFGSAFNKEDQDPNNDDNLYYRSALNQFKYIDPRDLPDDDYPPTVGEDVLTREFHSFSRVWTGTFYAALTALYESVRTQGKPPLESLEIARDTLGTVFGRALDELPPTGIRYQLVAESMLIQAWRGEDKATFKTLSQVFIDRDMLTLEDVEELKSRAQQPPLSLGDPEAVLAEAQTMLGLPDGFELETPPQRLSDGRTILLYTAPERHPLEGFSIEGEALDMELRSGLMLAFDSQGNLVNSVYTPVDSQSVEDARQMFTDLAGHGRMNLRHPFQSTDPAGRPYLARALPDRPGRRLVERVPIFD